MLSRKAFAIVTSVLLTLATVRCTPEESSAATPAASVARTFDSHNPVSQSKAATATAAALRLTVAPRGNEVRYRIREQLVQLPLPSDAIGRTPSVSGGIALDKEGRILVSESKFVVDASSLKSDRDMRDNYVRRRILETDQFPTVEFAPTAISGLPKKLPSSGTYTFEIAGNLTVHGVTKPTTWKATAKAEGGNVTGTASTSFTFSDFNLAQPRVPVLISVQDTIKLEYDFSLTTQS